MHSRSDSILGHICHAHAQATNVLRLKGCPEFGATPSSHIAFRFEYLGTFSCWGSGLVLLAAQPIVVIYRTIPRLCWPPCVRIGQLLAVSSFSAGVCLGKDVTTTVRQ